MSKVQVMDHPLIQHKISYIRSEEVGSKEFREIVGEIASLMCYEATRDLKLEDVSNEQLEENILSIYAKLYHKYESDKQRIFISRFLFRDSRKRVLT